MTASRPSVLATATALFLSSVQLPGQQWSCPDPWGNPNQPHFNVSYFSFIPTDHVAGPNFCYIGVGILAQRYPTLYKGDVHPGNPAYLGWPYLIQSWRVSSMLYGVTNEDRGVGAFAKDPMLTNQYSLGSPANGSFLSFRDEDYVPFDCFLWNNSGIADNQSWTYDVSFPYGSQSQVHYSGTASNPLEPAIGPVAGRIAWDMRIVNDSRDWVNPTSYAVVNHTCYPSHWIFVNSEPIYQYDPPTNEGWYIENCLLYQIGKITWQTQPQQVPCW